MDKCTVQLRFVVVPIYFGTFKVCNKTKLTTYFDFSRMRHQTTRISSNKRKKLTFTGPPPGIIQTRINASAWVLLKLAEISFTSNLPSERGDPRSGSSVLEQWKLCTKATKTKKVMVVFIVKQLVGSVSWCQVKGLLLQIACCICSLRMDHIYERFKVSR